MGGVKSREVKETSYRLCSMKGEEVWFKEEDATVNKGEWEIMENEECRVSCWP